ncbi:MAG: hypothetical protein ACXW32_14185 [Limisphaerales bacterium]
MTKISFNAKPHSLSQSALRFCLFTTLLALTFVLFTGCKSHRVQQNAGAPAETYALISVDGQPVPCSVTHNGGNLKINSGVFRFRPDGHCESSIELVSPAGQPVRKNVTATYSRDGEALTFQWKGAGKTKGTLSGDVFTMDNEGMVFSYQRQP